VYQRTVVERTAAPAGGRRQPVPAPPGGRARLGGVPEMKDRLRADLTTAMKARDELRTATLRMVLAAVSAEEVAGKEARELSDDEVQAVLRREAKKRREAADAFADAGRAEQAERERAEGEVVAGYLPAQLDDADLAAVVADVITRTGASGMKDMGKVMGAAQGAVAGRAEGARVAAEVRRQLG
jgi:uncharacterized protein YqeY